jgi:hypothetical protein
LAHPSSALGPLRGPCPCCMVMATVVIDKVNTEAETTPKEEKMLLKKWVRAGRCGVSPHAAVSPGKCSPSSPRTYMSDIACRGCGVCRTARAEAEWTFGEGGPNLDVDQSCNVCGISLLWAVWAGLVGVHPKYLQNVLSAQFAGLINKDAECEEMLVCDTCGAMDRTCFDCCPPAERAAWVAALDDLDAMNVEASPARAWGGGRGPGAPALLAGLGTTVLVEPLLPLGERM